MANNKFGVKDYLKGRPETFNVKSHAKGPEGELPLTEELLLNAPSGDLFGWSLNVGMGWKPEEMGRPEFLVLSTSGGVRNPDGTPLALGFHTGHWEVVLLVQEAAKTFRTLGAIPFSGFVTDPCDGRSQGTHGMMDSLPYRNDAAIVLRRLARSLPTRKGVLGVATCDKGLPAMMMAVAGLHNLPAIIVPGGVTLPADNGEDAGKVQTIGARFSHNQISLKEAAEAGCRACASPGGGCQFLGTAASAQVVAEALGLALPHSALAPSGQPVWLELAKYSAQALYQLASEGIKTSDILTPAAIRNAIVVHAAFGGSTNLLLHIPAIAHAAKLRRPTVEDWIEINRKVPRLVDALPNGPVGYPTVSVFLAGGVPEVMLHLEAMGLLDTSVLTCTGQTLAQNLKEWKESERRHKFRQMLKEMDGVNPDEVIFPPAEAKKQGLTSTVCFPKGNLAPEGAVIKATSIDASVVGEDGVYRIKGPARVFLEERLAIAAIKEKQIKAGDIIVLMCRGPMGSGMEETYQVTSALKHLSFGKHVALITDARFSGVSTGACIGHVGPEALAGGPIGKILEGDLVEIIIDRNKLEGSLNLVGENGKDYGVEWGNKTLESRTLRPDLAPDPNLPDDTRLWAALQTLGGGTWGGCVYDADSLINALKR
ncbi:MAG: YjhG/YagF family D-xylonate dehydratase [Planctomycetaceae bacterium]|nr:MAG: YjhG/YagF family D-xylonate dehydratase [Planctomycetaceae bacterium]